MATQRSPDEINALVGSSTKSLPAPREKPRRFPAVILAVVAVGLLAYALDNTYILFGRLFLPKNAYIPGGISLALLFLAEGLWLRR